MMDTVECVFEDGIMDRDGISAPGRFLAEDLSDPELVALVVGGGVLTPEGVGVAKGILERCERVMGLKTLTFNDLSQLSGLGVAGARAILASMELGQRVVSGELQKAPRISTSREVFELFRPMLSSEKAEVFYAALADSRLRLIKAELVARGSLTASLVHPREAYLPAVRYSASGAIFVHNHPSGDPSPSQEDFQLTRRLGEAGALLGIPMFDHLIVTASGYFSFADSGHIESGQRGDRGELCSSSGLDQATSWARKRERWGPGGTAQ